MSTVDGIPAIVLARWKEACAAPTIARWRSLAQMIASIMMTASAHAPGVQLVGDLKLLSDIAYQHAIDMQPVRDAA